MKQPISDPLQVSWAEKAFSLKYENYLQPKKQPAVKRLKQSAIEVIEYINEPIAQITEDEKWFRHHNWAAKRAQVLTALHAAGTGPHSLCNFENCGAGCAIEWSAEEKRYRIRGSFCHNRHCEPCMKAKSSLIINNLRTALANSTKRQHRFITLTMKHSDTPLKDQIKFLYACYSKLRKTKLWKKSQSGGAATLEVKWIPLTRKWHPHLHIISAGTFINTYDLSDEWRAITGDSHIVDVRLISADKDVAYYVGKYVTKGTNAEVWPDPEASTEWVKATRGVRMCATFGSWRGIKLLEKPADKGTWKPIASLAEVVRQAHAGSTWAMELLIHLTNDLQYNPARKRQPKPS